jgi:hypothetical protein
MPSGSGGQIAIISVSSLYHAVNSSMISAAAWTNFVSETLQHTLGELEEGAITGYKAAPPSHKGLDSGAGDIQLEPNPNALGHFLRGVFGQSSGTVLTDAGSWGAGDGGSLHSPPGYPAGRAVVEHRFVPSQSAFSERCYLPPYGVAVYRDTGSAMIFGGSVFSKIEFNIQAGQLAKATVSLMARDVTMHARTTSMQALRNPGGKPWVWDMTSIQMGPGVSSLQAFDKFEQLTISYETPIEGVVLLDGTKKYAEFQVNGFQRVTANGTMSFRNYDEYLTFKEYANKFLRVGLTNNNSDMVIGNPASANFFKLEMDIPQFKFLSWGAPIQGPNRLTVQFTGKGELDVTSLYNIEARLTNTTSAYT